MHTGMGRRAPYVPPQKNLKNLVIKIIFNTKIKKTYLDFITTPSIPLKTI